MKRSKHHQTAKSTGKPVLQIAWVDTPNLGVWPESLKDVPILVDKKYCGREYQVKDGEIYTVRLGLHSHPGKLGAFSHDSVAVCSIPTTIDKRLVLIAIFAPKEIYPSIIMDYVWLNADMPFRLELLHNSAALECNGTSQRLALDDEAVELVDDIVVISQNKLKEKLPNYYTYTYDLISFQVRVVFIDEFEQDKKPSDIL